MAVNTGWVDAVPTWTYGNTAIGNGTLTARTRRNEGRFDFSLVLIAGSTTNFGVATDWRFVLGGIVESGASSRRWVVPAHAQDSVGGGYYAGVAQVFVAGGDSAGEPTIMPIFGSSPAAATSPFVWSTGSKLYISSAVEAFDN